MGMKATADIFYSAPLLSAHHCGRYPYPACATFSGAPRLHLGHAAKIFNFWISLWTEETLSASVASHSCEENELTLYSTVPLPSLDGEHHTQSIQTATPSILNLLELAVEIIQPTFCSPRSSHGPPSLVYPDLRRRSTPLRQLPVHAPSDFSRSKVRAGHVFALGPREITSRRLGADENACTGHAWSRQSWAAQKCPGSGRRRGKAMLPARERHCLSLRSLPNVLLGAAPLLAPPRGCRNPELSLEPLCSQTKSPEGHAGRRTGAQTSLETAMSYGGQEFLCPDGWKAGEESGRGWRQALATTLSRGGWAGACLNHIFTAGEGFTVGL